MKTHFLKPFLFLLILALILSACNIPTSSTEAHSTLRRVMSPNVETGDTEQLTDGNTAFALDLYQALKGEGGNLFYSPYSISLALAMTYAGARGNTETQMGQVLHFDLPPDRLHPAFNAIDLTLTSHADGQDDNFELNIANSIWGQKDYTFQQTFLDTLAANYGAGLRLTDFVNAPEPARNTINQWVSDQTKERIKDLLPAGVITPDTRLVLANAIYFNAKWVYPFSHEGTRDWPFNTLDGDQINVYMMSLEHPSPLAYTQGQGYQAVELPYQGKRMSMVVVIPDAGTFLAFEAGFNTDQLTMVLDALQPRTVNLNLPKFKFESSFNLGDALTGLGMTDAFDSNAADFSGMNGEKDLFISTVVHKAFVAVDEEGTEAAAATAAIIETTSAILVDVNLMVDRPFLFFIRDMQTGTLLFAGRVVQPEFEK